MKTNICKPIGQITIACLLLAFALPKEVRAQFTGNNQTNIISGVTSNWTGVYYVGSNYVYDALLIQNGGVLANSTWAFIGYTVAAHHNIAIVSGSNSFWKCASDLYVGSGSANSLVITNGGSMFARVCYIGFGGGSSSNSFVVTGIGSSCSNEYTVVGNSSSALRNSLVINNGGRLLNSVNGEMGYQSQGLVTDGGSVWSNGVNLVIGTFGVGGSSSLVASNGGAIVVQQSAWVGNNASSNNSVLMTDTGSTLIIKGFLRVGDSGASNTLTIANNSSVAVRSNVFVGYASGAVGNRLNIAGGSLHATNWFLDTGIPIPGTLTLDIRRGTLTLDSGTVTADSLLLTNGTASVIAFNGGLVSTKTTAVTNSQQFVVGNGTNSATFHLLGGMHSFNNGLRIRTNSFLTGCGTINGKVNIDSGGAVHANCTNLVFKSSVTNNGTMVADGAVLETFGTFVNNGKIYLINGGTTNFHGTFINNGWLLNADTVRISNIARLGNDVLLRTPSVIGFTYRLQLTPSLLDAAWTDSGLAQPGSGNVLTFIDSSAGTNGPERFYRIRVQ